MATGPGVNQGKTKFVEERLEKDPTARADTINEAWKAAGHEDSISDSLVNKTRSRLKLTGSRGAGAGASAAKGKRRSPKGAAEGGQGTSQANGRTESDGTSKSAFVDAALRRDPGANVAAINRGWTKAGHEGSISDSVFYKVKRELGGSEGRSTGGEELAEAPGAGTSESKPATSGPRKRPGGREHPTVRAVRAESSASGLSEKVVDEVEAGIGDLMFTLKLHGGMPEVEEALRAARRLLTRNAGE